MAFVAVFEFRQNVERICSKSDQVMRINILSETRHQVRIRIFLANRSLLDVYYSSKTGKTAFAQIKDERRIFGADNTGGWHWHPVEDPETHLPSLVEISFEDFFKIMESNLK
jgi:hypothetical protein